MLTGDFFKGKQNIQQLHDAFIIVIDDTESIRTLIATTYLAQKINEQNFTMYLLHINLTLENICKFWFNQVYE